MIHHFDAGFSINPARVTTAKPLKSSLSHQRMHCAGIDARDTGLPTGFGATRRKSVFSVPTFTSLHNMVDAES
jgi:hypothetical protein